VTVICGRQELLLLVCLFGIQYGRVSCCAVELVESVAFVSVCVLAGFLYEFFTLLTYYMVYVVS